MKNYPFERRENDELIVPRNRNLWMRNVEKSVNPVSEFWSILGSFAILIVTMLLMVWIAKAQTPIEFKPDTTSSKLIFINRVENALMRVSYPDSNGVIKVWINKSRIGKEIVWRSDSTFIIKTK